MTPLPTVPYSSRSHPGHLPSRLHPFASLLLLFVPACGRQGFQSLPPVEVYFSPQGGCTEAVVEEINAAQTSILVQAYSFTSAPIAKALVDAHKRGVDVQATGTLRRDGHGRERGTFLGIFTTIFLITNSVSFHPVLGELLCHAEFRRL